MSITIDNPTTESVTILYVDDEELARKYFARAVGSDYEVLTAADADTAIWFLRDTDHQIGILVTDYRMPGRDGGDLLRQIEREFPHVVRILVTAYADREVLLDTVNSGEIFRILEKPLNLDEVRNTLRLASELARERMARQYRLSAMNETLAFLAHELNTPLASIVNFSRGTQRRLAEGNMPPQMHSEMGAAIQSINDNAQYCLSLLSAFVESAQGASSTFSPRANSAKQLILSLLDTYPLSAVERAMIRVDVREDFHVTALPNCVALVLSSILSNALRAVKAQPSPMICFTVHVDDSPRILIADNGTGISPDMLKHLTVDPVTAHASSGGTGWGMIFCKRIMQSFGGDIQVKSAPGALTTITLNFPAIKHQVKRNLP
jgi:two-component system response regulator PhcR